MSNGKPEFVVNWDGERVADALTGLLGHVRRAMVEPAELAIATAYFNPGGYALLADELDHPRRVRLLLGAEPQVPERRIRPLADPVVPRRAERQQLRRALEGHVRDLETDRDLLGFAIDADASARRLVAWLRSGRVEVRRLEDAFLHGKAFAVTSHEHGVIAGSSNFTHAGLATNIELNLGQYQPSVVRQVCAWFDDLWDRARPFDLAALYDARFAEHAPWVVFLRMLWERYGAELTEEADEHGVRVHLTSFQRDGLWRARRILAEHRGVLVADEVGLGKTFLAGELIREAVEERRQRVIVVAPATLRDGPWRKFLDDRQLYTEVVSPQQLAAGDVKYPDDYAMVVIDEAHAFRNPTTQQADALRRLLAGSPPKDVVLLTATPVNNSLWDLYHLLGYFLPNDAAFAAAGIRSLRGHFARAMALEPDDLTPEHLFDVLDAVAVRRTRTFIKRYYPNETVRVQGRDIPVTFPTPRVRKVSYDLAGPFAGFFGRFAAALDPGDSPDPADVGGAALTLARYAPSRYRRHGGAEAYELQLAGLLRSGLLKRFESSSHAFARTCRTMAGSHDGFLSLLVAGRVATGAALSGWMATDSDETADVQAFLTSYESELDDAGAYDLERLRADVTADRDLLLVFATTAEQVHRPQDPKLAALVEELAEIAADARREGVGEQDTRDKRKVLVFSYYADTVDWVVEHLRVIAAADPRLADYRDRITSTTGSSGDADDAMWGFAPRTSDAPPAKVADRYDVVVATDVLAEGVNLQQARHIVNYDLPWNPMRLVQRHGRIDRIGSPHAEIFLRCVFPDRQLDALLGLEERLNRKIKQAASAVGVAEHVLPDTRAADVVFTETREEIDRLREELDRIGAGDVTLFETAGRTPGAQSGEEYRKTLERALDDADLATRITALPWGSGSGFARNGARLAFVFCIRVGDHPEPLFRAVVHDEDGMADAPVADTLSCLAWALPPDGAGTPRVLDEATHARAYDAWASARDDVVARWTEATDPANLAPAVPRALREAAELLRRRPPRGLDQAEVDALVEAVEAPHSARVQRDVRRVLRDEDEQARADALAGLIRELGLQPSPPPVPLPVITAADVHLVCWLAIVPAQHDAS